MWGGGTWEKHVENAKKLATAGNNEQTNTENVKGYWAAVCTSIAEGLYVPTSEGFEIREHALKPPK